VSASPSSSPAPSSVASAYNVLLIGRPDVELAFDMSNGQVEGRVAVNGGVRAIGFGMGSRVTPCHSSTPALVVGGGGAAQSSINFVGGLQCGNLVADATARVIALPGFNSGNNRLVRGDVFNLTGLDFDNEAARAQATADAVCSSTGGVSATVSPWREITFQQGAPAAGATQQSFVVQAADLNQASSARFVFAQPSAVEKAVVAVRGGQASGVSLSNFWINNGGVSGARITFVVCEAPRVTLRGFGLEANLLAVDSRVTLENGQITGRVIAQTLSGSGGIRLP
jgi:choice-of-anchor A domain-containing protein